MPTPCKQLKHSINECNAFKSAFILEYKQSLQSGNLTRAKQLKQELSQQFESLEEACWPFNDLTIPEVREQGGKQVERLSFKELKQQYEFQKATFQKKTSEGRSILKRLENGELGIAKEDTVDGNEYPFPSFAEVCRRMIKEREKFKRKLAQGFTELQFTPFAMKLETLAKITGQTILDHKAQNHLFATKKNQDDPTEVLVPLELDTSQPLFVWKGWINPNKPEGERGADVTGECVYRAKKLTKEGHEGQTKLHILTTEETKDKLPFPGWDLKFIEPNPNIPRQGKGKTIGGRKQLEINQTPNEYLEIIKQANDPSNTTSPYRHEHYPTIEDWLTQLLNHLEKTNQVIDDYEGNGSVCYLPGSFNPASGNLGYCCWIRSDGRAYVSRFDPRNQPHYDGVRSAVGFGT